MRNESEHSLSDQVNASLRRLQENAGDILRRHFWLIIGAAGVVSFVLGVWGFREAGWPNSQAMNWQDAFYQTIQLIVINSGNLSGETVPWQLNIARFALPIIAGVLGFAVILAIFTEQKTLIWLWLFRHPLVVAGLGERGFNLARSQRKRQGRVVVIEVDPNNDRIDECKKLGATVLIGDATKAEVLRRVQLNKAEFLVSVCDDDRTNAMVAMRARDVTWDRKSGGLTCITHVVEPQLSTLLMGYAFGGQEKSRFRLECFNIYQSGARAMLRLFPPFSELDVASGKPHIVVVGLGRLGRWVLVQAVRRWLTKCGGSGEALRVTAIDRAATDQVAYLKARHPQLGAACNLNPIDLSVESGRLNRLDLLAEDGTVDVSAVYVCLSDESAALTAAIKLHRLLSHDTAIVVRMRSAGLGGLFEDLHSAKVEVGQIKRFGLLEETCDTELIEQSIYESIARAKHNDYLREQEKAGQTPETNSSMVPWGKLSAELKESNRGQAVYDRVRLRKLKYEIIPMSDWEPVPFEFTSAEVDELAKIEHERWMAEKELEGYRYAAGPKDKEKKTNPDLQEWTLLTEAEKRKDLDAAARIPGVLAEAEFQIIKLDGDRHDEAASQAT